MNSAREIPAISAARPWLMRRCSYHFRAAARRSSRAKPSGSRCRLARAPSGMSKAIWTMGGSSVGSGGGVEWSQGVSPADFACGPVWVWRWNWVRVRWKGVPGGVALGTTIKWQPNFGCHRILVRKPVCSCRVGTGPRGPKPTIQERATVDGTCAEAGFRGPWDFSPTLRM